MRTLSDLEIGQSFTFNEDEKKPLRKVFKIEGEEITTRQWPMHHIIETFIKNSQEITIISPTAVMCDGSKQTEFVAALKEAGFDDMFSGPMPGMEGMAFIMLFLDADKDLKGKLDAIGVISQPVSTLGL